MTSGASEQPDPVRLLFEMTRDDNPRLYDDLQRFKKGTKRVNRLRLLAHEGLMALQTAGRTGVGKPAVAARVLAGRPVTPELTQALITNQAFGLPGVDVERG